MVTLSLLAMLALWATITILQNSAAIAALVRSDKEARATVRSFLDAVCAGDAKTAASLAQAEMPSDDIAGLAEAMPRFGPVHELKFKKLNYYDTPKKVMYYVECFARFAHGGTNVVCRVWKVGDQWKMHDLAVDYVPKAPLAAPSIANGPTTLPADALDQAAPAMSIDVNKHYAAVIETKSGSITVDLFPKEAPLAVNNFVVLARKKFYDKLTFHRVIHDFMIQGGDPEGTGQGGPGYTFPDEIDPEKNPHEFKTGTLAMANSGPNTNGSQFFITHKPTPWLQGKHTIFGQVRDAKSQAVVNAIEMGDVILSIKIDETEK